MRLINADKLSADMYHEAFEKDSDMQKWDSGCWIRYKMFKNVLKAQPTVEAPDINVGNMDVISRQAAIDIVKSRKTAEQCGKGVVRNWAVDLCVDALEKLPSVQPERKTGRWLPDNTDYYRTRFICSVCGESEEVPTMGFGYAPMWGYCPNCGADMRGETE
jgi:hypothetical protein